MTFLILSISYLIKTLYIVYCIFTALCEYKGKQYTTGQKWQDGCQYDCECIDGMSGQYRCTEK